MSKLVLFPNPILRKQSALFSFKQHDLQSLVNDMVFNIKKYKGLGLAAVQVGVLLRVFIVDWEESGILVFINPKIIQLSDQKVKFSEGCLSIPGQVAEIERSQAVIIQYVDTCQKSQIMEASGLLAICIQHEIDHLNGLLFIDHLSRNQRNKVVNSYLKQSKNY